MGVYHGMLWNHMRTQEETEGTLETDIVFSIWMVQFSEVQWDEGDFICGVSHRNGELDAENWDIAEPSRSIIK